MSPGKDPSPLFEIINRSERARKRATTVPDWMRHADRVEHEVEITAASTDANGMPRPAWIAWLLRPVFFRVTVGLLAIYVAAVVAIILTAFLIGLTIRSEQIEQTTLAYDENINAMGTALQQPPNYSLIPGNIQRNTAIEPNASHGSAASSLPASAHSTAELREPGLNYFRLAQLPASARDDRQKVVQFLRENGIDAAAISINNGKAYKLMALRGFRKISGDEAKQYENRLRTLGRLWKTKHNGSSDWHDLFAERYTPGRT